MSTRANEFLDELIHAVAERTRRDMAIESGQNPDNPEVLAKSGQIALSSGSEAAN